MKREKVNLNNSHFDADGYVVDNYTGVKYIPITSNDVVITPNTRYYNDAYSSSKNYYDPESLPFIGPMSYWSRMMSSYIFGNDEAKAGVRESIRDRASRSIHPVGYNWPHQLLQLYNGYTSNSYLDVNNPIFLEERKEQAKKFADRVYSNNRARRGRSYKKIYDEAMQEYKDYFESQKQRQEFFQTYLGRQFDHKLLQPTNERPQKSKFNGRYFKLNSKQFDLQNEEALRYLLTNNKKSVVVNDNNLGDYTVSLGKDKNGDYYSAYDEWDISPFGDPGSKDQTLGIGKPYAVYNKYYYNPYNYLQYGLGPVYDLSKKLKPVSGNYVGTTEDSKTE